MVNSEVSLEETQPLPHPPSTLGFLKNEKLDKNMFIFIDIR